MSDDYWYEEPVSHTELTLYGSRLQLIHDWIGQVIAFRVGAPDKQAYAAVCSRIRRYQCFYCYAKAETFDHRCATAVGGDDSAENLVPSCIRCNQDKGTDWWPRYHRRRQSGASSSPASRMQRGAATVSAHGPQHRGLGQHQDQDRQP